MRQGHDHQWITDRIALGSAVLTADHVRAVTQEAITHVLDLRLCEGGADLWRGTAVTHLHCGTADDGKPKPAAWFERGVGFVLGALAVPRARILIHCALGVSRAPSMAYAVMRVMGWPPEEAVARIRRARALASVTYRMDADRAVRAMSQHGHRRVQRAAW
jgi:hypothetical protein